jgi:predicted nucleotidyltransferase
VVQIPEQVLALARDVARLAHEHIDPAVRVILFGSWAKGNAQPRSDLDPALDAGARLRPASIQRLQFACEELPTLRKIDLVDLHATDAALRREILATGMEL